MTTKIKWRLNKLPSVEEITLLLSQKVLTNEEAREILFSLENDEDRDKKSLQEEIKFLRELVQRLSSTPAQIIQTIKYVEKPYTTSPWLQPYVTWASNTDEQIMSSNFSTSNSLNVGSLSAGTGSLTYSTADLQPVDPFTDIKTF